MKNFSKFLAIVLSIAITVPMLALSAGAIDVLTVEEPQIISDTLQAVMEANTEETTRVAVWLKDIETEEALATNAMPSYQERLAVVTATEANSTATNEIDRSIEVKRTALNLCYEPYTESVGASYFAADEIVYASEYLPIVLADLTDERVAEVAELDVVEKMDFYCDDAVQGTNFEMDEGSLTAYASNTNYTIENNLQFVNISTLRGYMNSSSYVKVGVLDGGNPRDKSAYNGKVTVHYPTRPTGGAPFEMPDYLIVDNDDMSDTANMPLEDDHASYVLDIILATAPYADFYCTSYYDIENTTMMTEMEWLVGNDVHVINISYDLSVYEYKDEENGDPDDGYIVGGDTSDDLNTYGGIAQYLDQLIYTYGITIVQAAGNNGVSNSINLGIGSGGMAYNVITVGNYDRMNDEIYTQSSYYDGNALAYKPDISAPGIFSFNGTTTEIGTSFSTPIVTGIVALLMSYDISVKDDFRLIKSILTASTSAAHSYTPADSEYREFGAGVVDAERARLILYHYRTAGNVAMPSPSYQTHNISLSGSKSTRISMVFDKINTEEETYTLANLNLQVYDPNGNLVASSVTTNNNVEIVEFTATTYGTYQVRIVSVNVPSGDVYALPMYGISWLQW